MKLSNDQIKFLDRKIERFQSEVKQNTNAIQEAAEELTTAKFKDTTTRWISEYAEKLNKNRQILNALKLIKTAVETEKENNAPNGTYIKHSIKKALDVCVEIEDKYFRRTLVNIIHELI